MMGSSRQVRIKISTRARYTARTVYFYRRALSTRARVYAPSYHSRLVSRRFRKRERNFLLPAGEAKRISLPLVSRHGDERRDIKLLLRRNSPVLLQQRETHQFPWYFRSVNPAETATSLRAIPLTMKNENSALTISLIHIRATVDAAVWTFFARGKMIDCASRARGRLPAYSKLHPRRTRSGSICKPRARFLSVRDPKSTHVKAKRRGETINNEYARVSTSDLIVCRKIVNSLSLTLHPFSSLPRFVHQGCSIAPHIPSLAGSPPFIAARWTRVHRLPGVPSPPLHLSLLVAPCEQTSRLFVQSKNKRVISLGN